jgi:hypothetical protein
MNAEEHIAEAQAVLGPGDADEPGVEMDATDYDVAYAQAHALIAIAQALLASIPGTGVR